MTLSTVPQNWREELLNMADRACVAFEIKETTLGNKIVKDADFFPNIRKGSGCGVDQYNHIITWFSSNLPKELNHTKTRSSK